MLQVRDIWRSYRDKKWFGSASREVLKGVSFEVAPGEAVGLLGASGSGKSTLARIISGIEAPERGEVTLHGLNLMHRRHRRQRISVVFQDYTASINPSMTVFDAIAEPLRLQSVWAREALYEHVAALLARVGLPEALMQRYAAELSGGQAQRVCIARAIANQPDLIILDEAVSSLDVPVQVQILELLEALRESCGLSYLFITHDVMALCFVCQRVLFLDDGRIVESCKVESLPDVRQPYARRLLNAVI
ncbi:ABC transporter ATP-binding protein [Lampropedia aestuarii]|uniref:ABC transporter ATP-binding protein n=1 Tax=Lampropedia aestuarii TaxID=2562762 RepID=A0A4S5BSM2_9BURK|nr:dipeptide/oligopeptide/nickel ABC transporter ATP-binding protein [Lampropedia aestuarii]THJ34263.1 ABC transporter ATP-binding protein [Lampropedia aestuarii]